MELLTKKEFDILTVYMKAQGNFSQRELCEKTGHSLGTVNRTIKSLFEKGLLTESGVTPEGVAALEPYRVKRAIFLAAGFGSRLVPITLNTPKPLVRVHGERMIDSLLDALVEVGIEEIYIVRGYLAEQFDQLKYKYPMVRFFDNPLFNEENNISSALCVKDLFSSAYVMEADLILHNKNLIQKYQYDSNFLGIPVERSNDWCFTVKNGIIQSQKIGGALEQENEMKLYQCVGISYWSEEDGHKIAEHLQKAYELPGGCELYWDQTIFTVFPDQYKVRVRECNAEDIVEIDTFRELKQIDKIYDI